MNCIYTFSLSENRYKYLNICKDTELEHYGVYSLTNIMGIEVQSDRGDVFKGEVHAGLCKYSLEILKIEKTQSLPKQMRYMPLQNMC